MIQVVDLNKAYGDQVLFEGGSFMINSGERVGLVGRNGSGKSTLLKIILGEEHQERGQITKPRGYKIGHLAQHLAFTEASALEEVCLGLPLDERDQTYRGEIILSGLGFTDEDMYRSPHEFSGGFQIRINLARLLLSEPNLLLLDEPTNYLDIVSSRWLASTLRSWKNEILFITHDRSFMDSISTHTMLIYRGRFRKILGHTEKLYEAIALDEEVYEKTRLNDEKKRREMERFINRFRAKASKASVVQSRVKALEKMQVREELTEEDTLDFQFATKPFYGKTLMDLQHVSFGYTDDLPLIKDLKIAINPGERIGVIGKNGRGKSTLLRIMAKELKPNSGAVTLSPNTEIGYFGQTNIDRLTTHHTVEQEISQAHPGMHRTKVRGICGTMMFDGDKALKKISVLSGGERSRVLLGKIIATPSNLLLLDEPTNHLDLESVEALKDALKEYDGTVAIVTHNEMLLREICTRLIVFQGAAPFVVDGDYDYFLSKFGWEGEELPSKRPKAEVAKPEREKPKSSANRVREVQKNIAKLESEISKLESEAKTALGLLDKASAVGAGEEIQKHSLNLHQINEKIEKAFEELVSASDELKQLGG